MFEKKSDISTLKLHKALKESGFSAPDVNGNISVPLDKLTTLGKILSENNHSFRIIEEERVKSTDIKVKIEQTPQEQKKATSGFTDTGPRQDVGH